jgi:hypothetical protein
MGFRNPAKSLTPSALNTGGTQPVVITGTGGLEGGGAVLLYPNTGGDAPGRLEAGSDESGGLTRLYSPPNDLGLSSTVVLTGTDNPATDGVYVESAGGIRLVPATGRDVSVDGALRLLNAWRLATVTTDASGVVVITHGLGYTPGVIFVQSRSTTTSPLSIGVNTWSATTITLRIYLGTAPLASASAAIAWLALR